MWATGMAGGEPVHRARHELLGVGLDAHLFEQRREWETEPARAAHPLAPDRVVHADQRRVELDQVSGEEVGER